jgi:hypothetical protein
MRNNYPERDNRQVKELVPTRGVQKPESDECEHTAYIGDATVDSSKNGRGRAPLNYRPA